ncbi:MAG: hypothetical protein KAI79_06040 [Bacteroidales bacterium]|nr:hypothetical protein [Bacteroidales bacterium]
MKVRPIAVTIGFVLLFYAIFLNLIFPQSAAIMPEGFSSPIIAFEFADTEAEIIGLFSFSDTKQKLEFIGGMIFGNYFDFGYMFVYSMFLASILWWIRTNKKLKFSALLYILIFISFISDGIENYYLLSITEAVRVNESFVHFIPFLHAITWVKWGVLAVIFSFYFILFFPSNKILKILNYLLLLPIGFGIISLFYKPYFTDIFVYTIILSFLLSFVNVLIKPKQCEDSLVIKTK